MGKLRKNFANFISTPASFMPPCSYICMCVYVYAEEHLHVSAVHK